MSEPKQSARFTQSVGSIRRRKRLTLVLRLLLALASLTFALFPVLWVFSASINPTNSLVGQPLIPDNPSFANYRKLFTDPVNPFPRWYLNSLFLAILVTVVGTAMTTLAAYSFSRFRFRSRQSLLQAILLIQVFPNFLNMVALFLILQQIGARLPMFGLNTYGGLLLVYWGGTLGANTWLTKGYFDSIPRDLDEAAEVDGASPWQTFTRVLLPPGAADPGGGGAADLHLHLFGIRAGEGAAHRQDDVHPGRGAERHGGEPVCAKLGRV